MSETERVDSMGPRAERMMQVVAHIGDVAKATVSLEGELCCRVTKVTICVTVVLGH